MAQAPKQSENIAPFSNASAESWWLKRTPQDLIDGDPRLLWGKAGWYSGTRFPTNAGIFQTTPIYFDFHRSEAAEVSSVELTPNLNIAFAVDLFDGKKWQQVAQNAQPGLGHPSAPSKVIFPEASAYSVRVRLLGYVGPTNPNHFPNAYKVGEIKIFGRLKGTDLAQGLRIDVGSDSQRTAAEGESPRLPLRVTWDFLPVGVSHGEFEVEAILGKRYGNRFLQTRTATVSGSSQTLVFNKCAPGAYMVHLCVRNKSTGAPLLRTETTLGIVDPRWKQAKIAPLAAPRVSFSAPLGLTASASHPLKWVRCADINGVDSILDVPNIDYYLHEAAKTDAVAEIFLPWPSLEPLPGVYDFDLADKWFESAARHGARLRINMNPPYSGFVPEWLKGHEILQHQPDGTAQTVEALSMFSPLVREHATRLFELLMKRYGAHPCAAMWVINLNGEFPWKLEETRYEDVSSWAISSFREYLRKKYGTIDRLNSDWETRYQTFDGIEAPDKYDTAEWTNFCDFMLKGVISFYEPIAANARRLLGKNAIILTTGGYLTAEPFISFAKRYSLWQSSHSQENPQFVSWGSLWRSHHITRFGEPGLVNIDMIDVNRAFFINAICGATLYTYRQYDWPNPNAWQAFIHQQTIADKLINADPIHIPIALAGMFTNGLATAKKTFSIGGVWYPLGCFNDALLKAGVIADFYDGENPGVLKNQKAVLELGSTFFSQTAIRDLESYVRSGGTLLLFPPLSGNGERRFYEKPQSQNGDVLLTALGNRVTLKRTGSAALLANVKDESWLNGFTGTSLEDACDFQGILPPQCSIDLQTIDGIPAAIQWPHEKGTVIHFSGTMPDRRISGNGRPSPDGTGWNIEYNSPETQKLIALLMKRLGLPMPYDFHSDAPNTWACGFTNGEVRYILFYNNEASRTTNINFEKLDQHYFPANSYQLNLYTMRTELKSANKGIQARENFLLKFSLEPLGLGLLELKPIAEQPTLIER